MRELKSKDVDGPEDAKSEQGEWERESVSHEKFLVQTDVSVARPACMLSCLRSFLNGDFSFVLSPKRLDRSQREVTKLHTIALVFNYSSKCWTSKRHNKTAQPTADKCPTSLSLSEIEKNETKIIALAKYITEAMKVRRNKVENI